MKCKLILPSEKIILENSTQIINKPFRELLKKESRNSTLKAYQNRVNKILNKQFNNFNFKCY